MLTIDLYRYFIGRDDQSVNEKGLNRRVDHYWRSAQYNAHIIYDDISSPRLQTYMILHHHRGYLLNLL